MTLKEKIELEQEEHRTRYGRVYSLFDKSHEKLNFITFSGHFHIKFKNGYEISLFHGKGSYTDNLEKYDKNECFSKYMELAIIKDGYFCTRDFIPTNDDDVIGMIDAERVADIIFQVKNKEGEK